MNFAGVLRGGLGRFRSDSIDRDLTVLVDLVQIAPERLVELFQSPRIVESLELTYIHVLDTVLADEHQSFAGVSGAIYPVDIDDSLVHGVPIVPT